MFLIYFISYTSISQIFFLSDKKYLTNGSVRDEIYKKHFLFTMND